MRALAETLSVTPTSRWPLWTALTLAVMVVLLGIFWPTLYSMVEVWNRSETFTHAYMIFPISAWLIWRKRAGLVHIIPAPDWRGLILMGLAGAAWLLADAGSMNIGAQYALIAMLIAAVGSVLGFDVIRALFFPLMFMFLAVPVGEFLMLPLMNFTANFTVAALQFTGIPVYREGTFFSIPSGDWSVVEACSGLRYLIASVTLGSLYAYLTYRSWQRRALFTLAAFIVPVFANGMRAYLIVMIGHFSNMKLAVGIDHLIYGWVFFGLVMMLLFWIGSFWREDQNLPDVPHGNFDHKNSALTPPLSAFLFAAIGVLMVAAVWPVYAHWLEQRPLPEMPALRIQAHSAWQPAAAFTDWIPHWIGADRQLRAHFVKGGQKVLLEMDYYATQRQNAELINSQNFMVQQRHPLWSEVGQGVAQVEVKGQSFTVHQSLLKSIDGRRLLAWQWNVIDGHPNTSDIGAKLSMATDRLRLARDDGASIVLATPYEDQPEEAARVLANFVQDNATAIQRGLDQVSGK